MPEDRPGTPGSARRASEGRDQQEKEEQKRIARQIAREEEMKRWEEMEEQRRAEAEARGEEDEEQTSDNNQEEFVCVACRKTFKSEKAFSNHENSKKHKQEVEKLRKELMLSDDEIVGPTVEESLLVSIKSATNGKKKKKKNLMQLESASDTGKSDVEPEVVPLPSKKGKKKKNVVPLVQFDSIESEKEFVIIPSGDEEFQNGRSGEDARTEKKSRRRKKEPVDTANPFSCKACGSKFPTKSALFRHLDSTGHHAPLR
jgi:DnaJ family protein A protein 5